MSKQDKIEMLSKAAAFALRRGKIDEAKRLRLTILRMIRG